MLRLASASPTRQAMLSAAGLSVMVTPAQIDEACLRAELQRDGVEPATIALRLAGAKAAEVAARFPADLTLGADQVLDLDGIPLGKPSSPAEAREMLARMSGRTHQLHSAIVVNEGQAVLWRHVGTVEMRMLPLSAARIETYVARNWEQIRHSAGAYQIEAEGIQLFSAIGADYHVILGLPLLALLDWLRQRGDLPT